MDELQIVYNIIAGLALNAYFGFLVIITLDDDGHHLRWLNAAPSKLALLLALEFWLLVVWLDARRYWERDK